MRKKSYEFLKSLIEQPSPSGYEQPAQRVYRNYVKGYADEVSTDVMGNVAATIRGKQGHPVAMLAGHCDEIGFMANYIDDNGFIYFRPIGGVDPHLVPGRRVTVHTGEGPVLGVIGRKPIHLHEDQDRKKIVDMKKQFIDIGVKDREAAKSLVSIGDPVTFVDVLEPLQGDRVASRGCDDKTGSFIVAEVLRLIRKKAKSLKATLHAVSTVQEEIGLRGARTSAYGLEPDVGIAVEVTHATDYPDVDKKSIGDIRLGHGPVVTRGANINPKVFDLLVETARREKIPIQIEGYPRGTGTDANVIQLTRRGVATGLVSIPLRYMHTPVEVVSLADLEAAANLITAFVLGLDKKVSFIPE